MTADKRQIPEERRSAQHTDRRSGHRGGGRRATDEPHGPAWTTGQLAHEIGMSADFVVSEIRAGELVASKFGREYRIAAAEIRRYLTAKQFPVPDHLASEPF